MTHQILILSLLDENGPMYGLDMIRHSGGRLRRGTVYVLLANLCDAGLVDSYPDGKETLPGQVSRLLFRITGPGRLAMARTEMFGGGLAVEPA